MLIEAKMSKGLDIGDWFPEDDKDIFWEDQDIILKAKNRTEKSKELVTRYPTPGIIGIFSMGSTASIDIKACRQHRCMLCFPNG